MNQPWPNSYFHCITRSPSQCKDHLFMYINSNKKRLSHHCRVMIVLSLWKSLYLERWSWYWNDVQPPIVSFVAWLPWNLSDVLWALRHGKSLANPLFVTQLTKANIKESVKAQHYWLFVLLIRKQLVDSLHKGSVMQKVFPYHDIIM